MSTVMNIVAASMHNDADQMSVVAQNMASANVVAYQQRIPVLRDEFARVAESTRADTVDAAMTATVPSLELAVDPTPGTLSETSEPLNVAVQGNGYFVVDSAQGQLLTRRGDFHVDASGTLCAFSGDPVVGTEGEIRIKGGTPQINADGTVLVANQVVGHLEIAQPASGATLQPAGDGFFTSSGGQVSAGSAAQVRQGFLETSNVSPVNQMVTLMQVIRHFEAGQRFVRAYDEMLNDAIDDLGKV